MLPFERRNQGHHCFFAQKLEGPNFWETHRQQHQVLLRELLARLVWAGAAVGGVPVGEEAPPAGGAELDLRPIHDELQVISQGDFYNQCLPAVAYTVGSLVAMLVQLVEKRTLSGPSSYFPLLFCLGIFEGFHHHHLLLDS